MEYIRITIRYRRICSSPNACAKIFIGLDAANSNKQSQAVIKADDGSLLVICEADGGR